MFDPITDKLIATVQELSHARELETIQRIVRQSARALTGSDGATFVLRDNGKCYYADEDAIAPLWKGQRFPMSACISGWAMLNRQAVSLPDIYADARIPADAYRPTFVKSLVMVPIRETDPIGAIGVYWASSHTATENEIRTLQALADSTSIAMENVRVYAEIEGRVRERTALLQAANEELEAFSYAVSHDLRAPVRAIAGFGQIVEEDYAAALDDEGRKYLGRIRAGALRMGEMIEDLLKLSRMQRVALHRQPVDLAQIARKIVGNLQAADPARSVSVVLPETLPALADPGLLNTVLENLLSNAWKYTSKTENASIELFSAPPDDSGPAFCIRDNGAGFDSARATKLFAPFQRFHTEEDFPGTGVGLATVQRIIRRHEGRCWAESRPGEGAAFFFTLGVTAPVADL